MRTCGGCIGDIFSELLCLRKSLEPYFQRGIPGSVRMAVVNHVECAAFKALQTLIADRNQRLQDRRLLKSNRLGQMGAESQTVSTTRSRGAPTRGAGGLFAY